MTYAPPAELKRLITEVYQLEELYDGSNLRRKHKTHYLTVSGPKQDGLPTKIEVEINNSYPFRAPIVHYINTDGEKEQYTNTIHYCHMPRISKHMRECINHININHEVNGTLITTSTKQNISNHECFHCSFILNDWSPAMRIIHVVYEIQRVNYLKRKIKYRISLERIKCIPEELISHIISFIDPIWG
jgi:ubiquitin-protein ligase